MTRALGIEEDVEVDVVERHVDPGDMFLLCSDGLNDMIDDAAIGEAIRKNSDNLVKAGNELIRLANKAGGNDNISVVLVRARDTFSEQVTWQSKLGRFFGLG